LIAVAKASVLPVKLPSAAGMEVASRCIPCVCVL
jgi:hypothetical protein